MRLTQFMKTNRAKFQYYLFFVLALFTGTHQIAAQVAQFFRIVGPTATTITAFNPDGTIVWSNGQAGGTYSVETASSLLGETNWVNYVILFGPFPDPLPPGVPLFTNKIFDFNPPTGMVFIPAGVFTMGDTVDGYTFQSDAVPTNVYVSAFYMDVNLVSYSQWQSVYNWATNNGYSFDDAGIVTGPDQAMLPEASVNWYDCVKWSNARSQQAGLAPVYYTDINLTQIYTNGDNDYVYANWIANGYRLPTEAEWEKAARGGLIGQRFPWGDTISESQANYYSVGPSVLGFDLSDTGCNPIFQCQYSPVGSFAPNGYGLYDMAGNAMEWCWDWAGTPYGQPTTTNPTGPASGFPLYVRIARGGSTTRSAQNERCAARQEFGPISPSGFRCVVAFFSINPI
jgi:formylglycine-generating enzyme required for sulfatase activity